MPVLDAVEIDNNTFITAAYDAKLKVWNKASLPSNLTPASICDMRERRHFSFVSGSKDETVEGRDGPGDYCGAMKRWDKDGKLLQIFPGVHSQTVDRVIELQSDIIVASSWDNTATVWKVSTGQLLRQLRLPHSTGIG